MTIFGGQKFEMSLFSAISSKRLVLTLYLIAAVLSPGLFVQSAYAQNLPHVAHDSSYEEVFSPELTTTSVLIDDDEEPALEPNIGQIRFFAYPTLTSVEERIDRLLHGINTYIRPEFDQYGHEIRRYMAHVGDMRIYSDPDFLLDQYRNVKKAKVIAEYWRKHLEKEIAEIESALEEDDSISLSARTAFRQNKNLVRTFVISLKSWVDSNEQILRKIGENQEIYTVRYPEVLVYNAKDRVDLYNLLSIRAAKLKDIRQYSGFALMVY